MKYLVIFWQTYSENTAEYGYGDCPVRLDYLGGVVEGETPRKAEVAARKRFPNVRFGRFGARLLPVNDPMAHLYTKPGDIRLRDQAKWAHRQALAELKREVA
jgi:hypothetical protein